MTTAVSQILEQTKLLSQQEQLEIVNELLGQTRQNGEPTFLSQGEPTFLSQNDAENDEAEDVLDASSLKRVPPKDSYEIKVKFLDGGRGQPRRYDFGDRFDEEEGED